MSQRCMTMNIIDEDYTEDNIIIANFMYYVMVHMYSRNTNKGLRDTVC